MRNLSFLHYALLAGTAAAGATSSSAARGTSQAVGQAHAQADADAAVKQALIDLQTAQNNPGKLLTTDQYNVQLAQAAYNGALANLQLKQNGSTAQDVAVAQAAVDQAGAQVKQAQANLDAATLAAPFAGTIAATGANPGEQVTATTPVVTLVDTHQVRVDVVVDETDVAKVQPGQQATLTFEALPGRPFDGTIAVIAPAATVQNGVANYTVQIQLDPAQAQDVKPGMTATAQIVTASKDDAVLVPNRAVRTQGRAKTVEVLDPDGKTETVPVQTGLASDQVTEITGGLQPGAQVVIPGTATAAPRAGAGGLGGLGVGR